MIQHNNRASYGELLSIGRSVVITALSLVHSPVTALKLDIRLWLWVKEIFAMSVILRLGCIFRQPFLIIIDRDLTALIENNIAGFCRKNATICTADYQYVSKSYVV